jgi:peptidoglycan hydrolase-like protein with peptidoglycan-binding domain
MQFSIRSMKLVTLWVPALLLSAALCLASTTSKSSTKPKQSSAKSVKSSTSKTHTGSRKSKRSKKASWRRGQQKMDAERARQVQQALIREHYLTGEPTGVWDQRSQNAMVRFQAENGWQTKVVPDSRALIKLGLGPSNDHLLNPESAMTSPLRPTSERIPPTSNMGHGAPASTPISPASAPSPEPVSNPQK